MKYFVIATFLAIANSSLAFGSGFACSNEAGSIQLDIRPDQKSGTMVVDERELELECTGGVRYGLTCKAYLSTSIFEVYIHKFLTRASEPIFAGNVTRIIGGIAGNVTINLGSITCSE